MIHRYNGVMADSSNKLYTAEQVRGIDYAAIHELDIPGYTLMCRAGEAVMEAVSSRFPTAGHWLIMCGPGNNGGDGYVVARLAAQAGMQVTVCSLADPEKLRGDAAQAWLDWQATGGETASWPLPDDACFDLALDAMLGTGIDREVTGDIRQAIDYVNQLDCPRVAIDIPSGLNADTGCVMGDAVRAQHTITFVGHKRGMYTADGPDYCGSISFNDLAIPPQASKHCLDKGGRLLSVEALTTVLKPRLQNSHKGSFGHVYAVGGIKGMSGAIRLCGEAALRSGAGRVTLVTDERHADLVNLGRPELMVKAVAASGELPAIPGSDTVIAVGPGLGTAQWSKSLLLACYESQTPLVLDADGLNVLSQLSNNESMARGNWILTPHPAEAARLLGCSVTEIQQDRVTSAQSLSAKFGAVVILKGCGTVITDTVGQYAICPLGNPGMATAGSGDVLTGVVAALLAQGHGCFDAAWVGVLVHAAAGDFAAGVHGETALIAGDIIGQLSSVWRQVGL